MDLPKRKPIRLKEYDYSQIGCYYITLCVQNRLHIFETENAAVGNDLCVVPCDLGVIPQNKIIHKWFYEMEIKFGIKIDKFVIMPDHIHFIINIHRSSDITVPEMMQWFKTMTTNEYIRGVKELGFKPFDKKLWQKSYHEHIIRNNDDYLKTLQYIAGNPMRERIGYE